MLIQYQVDSRKIFAAFSPLPMSLLLRCIIVCTFALGYRISFDFISDICSRNWLANRFSNSNALHLQPGPSRCVTQTIKYYSRLYRGILLGPLFVDIHVRELLSIVYQSIANHSSSSSRPILVKTRSNSF